MYQAMVFEYSAGKKNEVEVAELRTELDTMRLTNKWNKPLKQFLSQWEHKILDYERVADLTCTDKKKRDWITTTIEDHDGLSSAISNSRSIEMTMQGMVLAAISRHCFC